MLVNSEGHTKYKIPPVALAQSVDEVHYVTGPNQRDTVTSASGVSDSDCARSHY